VQAMAALKFYGSAARHEVPLILKGTAHRDASMRVNATITLGFVGVNQKDAENALKDLKRLLYDKEQIIKYQAAVTILRLRTGENQISAYDATPALINAMHLESNSYEVRNAATTTLGWVAWTDKGFDRHAWLELLKATGDPVSEVRMSAVLSLILFGRPANGSDLKMEEKFLQSLTGEKQNKRVAIWAYIGLLRIADHVSDTHLRGISKFLKTPDVQVRLNAARALAVAGPDGASQAPALMELLNMDEDPGVLYWVITALGRMGPKAKEAEPYLEKLKEHKEQSVRDAVKIALEKLNEKMRQDDAAPDKKKKPK
jgi:HEAT repeat protein